MQDLITFFPSIMDVPDKPATLISAQAAYLTAFGYGQTSWICPYTGFWSFIQRGGGGDRSGGSGAATKTTKYLVAGQVVNFTIGLGARSRSGSIATATIVNFPDGTVVTAGGGVSNGFSSGPVAGGVATGGDININGNIGNSTVGGAAPDIDTFPGAPAGDATTTNIPGPGAGTGFNGSGGPEAGGNGELYIYSVGQ